MNQVARSTQYPIGCTKCGARTAFSIAKLLEQKTVKCRHCQETIELQDKDQRLIRRTLKDVCYYVSKPELEEVEESMPEWDEQNSPESETADLATEEKTASS